MQFQAGQQTRLLLKYIHTLSAMMWIGGAQAILVLLYKDRQAANGDELFAFNDAIRTIDNWLIAPGVAGTIASGGLICLVTNWGFLRHRWVVVKWVVTAVATLFGVVFLGPWFQELAELAGLNRLAVFDSWAYARTYQLGVSFGIAQTAVLVVLMLISIFKPELDLLPPRASFLIRPLVAPVVGLHSQFSSRFRQGRD
ncbi:DUF2269 family protein [Geobacter pickeringii]|uniref:DUF2269 family protein n=1 Tax=Geobacter pickeringii TaxID=345632 RepID=UPI00068E1F8D|nr:hypothetical protein [Geobacter pickeringii]